MDPIKGKVNITIEPVQPNEDFLEKLGAMRRWICDHSPTPNLNPSQIIFKKCILVSNTTTSETYSVEYEIE